MGPVRFRAHRCRQAVFQESFLHNACRCNYVRSKLLLGSLGIYVGMSLRINYTALKFHEKVEELEEFWQGDALARCPHWFEFAMISYLHQPSSAAAERVFSVLKRVLTAEREDCLDDLVKASVYSIYEKLSNRKRVRDEM